MNDFRFVLPIGPLPPREEPPSPPRPRRKIDPNWPRAIGVEALDALAADDDYEPLPEYGDFWIELDAA